MLQNTTKTVCMSQSTSHSFLLGLIHFFYVGPQNYKTTMLSTRAMVDGVKKGFFQFRRHFLTNRIYVRHYKNISTHGFYIQCLGKCDSFP